MERKLSVRSSTAVLRFSIACAAVRRAKKNKDYFPRDYEVYLMNGGLQPLSFPTWNMGVEQEPSAAVLDNMQCKLGLFGTSVYPLAVSCMPPNKHTITMFNAVPVFLEDVPSQEGKYYNLSQVMDAAGGQFHNMEEGTRSMLTALDEWLRQRHTLPFVNVDTVFLCSREGEGVGGLVKAIIENPIRGSHLRPPEDNLVISLNNPVFEMTSTQAVDTTITSNA